MKSARKPLIDVLINQFDEYSSKELYSIIMCGQIKVNGETIRSSRQLVRTDSDIVFTSKKWVSRGGEKLEHAVKCWDVDVRGKTVLDAGSSTGGFTDCLLQYGAKLVHSVDVGYNQLDYSLRSDSRVNVLERTNVMSLEALDPRPDFAVADLSFRSISGAASHILNLTTDNLLIALIKPQFEIESSEDFDGVIRDTAVLKQVVIETARNLEREGVAVNAVLESPIKGGKGNTEFLFSLSRGGTNDIHGNTDAVKKLFDFDIKE